MSKPTIAVNPSSFPNQMATDKEKASEEYGMQVGKAIQY